MSCNNYFNTSAAADLSKFDNKIIIWSKTPYSDGVFKNHTNLYVSKMDFIDCCELLSTTNGNNTGQRWYHISTTDRDYSVKFRLSEKEHQESFEAQIENVPKGAQFHIRWDFQRREIIVVPYGIPDNVPDKENTDEVERENDSSMEDEYLRMAEPDDEQWVKEDEMSVKGDIVFGTSDDQGDFI